MSGDDSRPLGLVVALSGAFGVLEVGYGLWSTWSGFTGLGGETLAAFGIGLWGVLHLTIGAFCLRGAVHVWRCERRGRRTLLRIGKVYAGLLLLALMLSGSPIEPWIHALLAAILFAWGVIIVYLWERKGMFGPVRT